MKAQKIRYAILMADLLWIPGALALGIGLRYAGTRDTIGFAAHFQAYSLMILAAIVAWTFLYFDMSLDGFGGGWHLPAILSKFIVSVALVMAIVLVIGFITREYYSRLVLLYFALFFSFGLIAMRCLVRFLAASQLKNASDRRCVILGGGPVARELGAKIASHPEIPFQIVGYLFPNESEALNGFAKSLATPFTSVTTLEVLGLLAQQKVQKLIVAMPQPSGPEVRKLIAECRKASIQVYLVPQWYDLYVSQAQLVEIDGLPLFWLQERNIPVFGLALRGRSMSY